MYLVGTELSLQTGCNSKVYPSSGVVWPNLSHGLVFSNNLEGLCSHTYICICIYFGDLEAEYLFATDFLRDTSTFAIKKSLRLMHIFPQMVGLG